MAELLHEQNQSAEAVKHLAQAADRARQDPTLQSYLASVTAKVQRMDSVESRMTARSSEHFMVKFDGAEDQAAWTVVLDILEDAIVRSVRSSDTSR
jgi:predicted Zn-dependent protease